MGGAREEKAGEKGKVRWRNEQRALGIFEKNRETHCRSWMGVSIDAGGQGLYYLLPGRMKKLEHNKTDGMVKPSRFFLFKAKII